MSYLFPSLDAQYIAATHPRMVQPKKRFRKKIDSVERCSMATATDAGNR